MHRVVYLTTDAPPSFSLYVGCCTLARVKRRRMSAAAAVLTWSDGPRKPRP
jgi:hypothetical protein